MTLIKHLTDHVTPQVWSSRPLTEDADPFYEQLLLEQFYAIVMARLEEQSVAESIATQLADPVSRLERNRENNDLLNNDRLQEDSPFNQAAKDLFAILWPDARSRQQIIASLADTYYTSYAHTSQLISLSLPLLYDELNRISQSKEISVHQLVTQQIETIRAYVPSWALPFTHNAITDIAIVDLPAVSAIDNSGVDDSAAISSITESLNKAIPRASLNEQHHFADDGPRTEPLVDSPTSILTQSSPLAEESHANESLFADQDIRSTVETDISEDTAVHASPNEYRDDLKPPSSVASKKASSLVILRVLIAVAIFSGLIWLALRYYQNATNTAPQEPQDEISDVNTVPLPQNEASPTTAISLRPVELTIKMDINQLYVCQGIVGNEALQGAVLQALHSAMADQARQCQIIIDPEVATEMSNLHSLSQIVTVVQSVPFATLELRGNNLSLSAPDPNVLSQMTAQIQSIAPAIHIEVLAPIEPSGTINAPMGSGIAPNMDGQLNNANSMPPMTEYQPNGSVNANMNNYYEGNSQLQDDASQYGSPNPNMDQSRSAIPNTGAPEDQFPANTGSGNDADSISEKELENMLNTVIEVAPN